MALLKPNSNSDMQTTLKSFRHEKHQSDTNFQRNYGALKATTTPQISYGKYFENTRGITLIPKDVPCV